VHVQDQKGYYVMYSAAMDDYKWEYDNWMVGFWFFFVAMLSNSAVFVALALRFKYIMYEESNQS
jgi:hypothetical protein